MSIDRTIESPDWTPDPLALSVVRRSGRDDGGPTSVSLRHPTAPFVRPLDTSDAKSYEKLLQTSTLDYLEAADGIAEIGLPQEWLDALRKQICGEEPDPNALVWLPLEDKHKPSPFSSHWIERRRGDYLIDRTLIMGASEHIAGKPAGSGLGIRVVAQVRQPPGSKHDNFRITSMSASFPAENGVASPCSDQEDLGGFLKLHIPMITALLNFEPGTVRIRAIALRELGGKTAIEFRGVGRGALEGRPEADAIYYEYLAASRVSDDGKRLERPRMLKKVPLVVHACEGRPGEARVFPRDPVSQPSLPHEWQDRTHTLRERRPTRSEFTLDRYRECESIVPGTHDPLEDGPGRLRVMRTRFVREDLSQLGNVKRVHLPTAVSNAVPPVRSNDFSAVNGLRNPRQIFERLIRYGIDPNDYFRYARLPLEVYYRSGLRPGPGKDGQTVNAWVHAVGWDDGQVGIPPDADAPRLELHFALANLSHRARDPWDRVNRSPAEPLGIAADPRWMWHELGHVLLMASTGELEMRFAHSPGDALAAIVADPQSDLATEPNRAWRGATFPWVFIPRRHDRCVHHGWSWSGTMHRPLRDLPDTVGLRRKGYRSEQILSSSLFRLYLCLGGDTNQRDLKVADVETRCSASHYAVFLIIQALRILDDARLTPANEPNDLVLALIAADVGTEEFVITDPCDDGSATATRRIGGCAQKAIHWAFEAQGLSDDPGPNHNGPGIPPPVDVYIEDARSTTETTSHCPVEHRTGSYVPVSLEVPVSGDGVALPGWFATATAIDVQENEIFVTVSNRGSQQAQAVTVRVWQSEWAVGTTPPDWLEGTRWTEIPGPLADQPVNPDPDPDSDPDSVPAPPATFGPFPWAPDAGKRYLILAQTTCEADKANTDPSTSFPCSREQTPLVDLVANDNNLGVQVWPPPD